MRFVKSEAGHIEKIYYAVKAASMISSNDPTSQRELFPQLWNKAHPEAKINSVRSAESHLSFARELNLLTQRGQNRSWQLTNSFGRSFLTLYERCKKIPKNLLLSQFMLNDKDILILYLSKVLNSRLESHAKLFQEAWKEFYNRNKTALIKMEPIVPKELQYRTCKHHVEARDKFLMRSSGIGLNFDNLETVYRWLQKENLEDEIFLATNQAISCSTPTELSPEKIVENISNYHKLASAMSFASAKGAWAFVNELSSPNHYAKWSTTLGIVQSSKQFMTQPSYDPKDVLYSIRGRTAGMQCI